MKPRILLNITGSDKFLSYFVNHPNLTAHAYYTGFTVKENTLSFAFQNIVNLGLNNFLTGDAKWSDLSKLENENDSLGGSFLGISGGESRSTQTSTSTSSSYVSRDQVKRIARDATKAISGSVWIGAPDQKTETDKIVDLVVGAILEDAKFYDATITKEGQDYVLDDPQIKKDLEPDRISDINQTIKNATELQKKATYGSGGDSGGKTGSSGKKSDGSTPSSPADAAGSAGGGGGAGGSAGGGPAFSYATDFKWDNAGGSDNKVELVIPKTIRLYQMNQARFSSFASYKISTTEATSGQTAAKALLTSICTGTQPRTEPGVPPHYSDLRVAYPFSHSTWYDHGNDADLYIVENRPLTFEFNADLTGYIYLSYDYRAIEGGNNGTVCRCMDGSVGSPRSGVALAIPQHSGHIVGFSRNSLPVRANFTVRGGAAHQPQPVHVSGTMFEELTLYGDGNGNDCARLKPGQTLADDPPPTNCNVRGRIAVYLKVEEDPGRPPKTVYETVWQAQ
jgi:hypothetical protein